jgi:hypothetical protein
MRVKRLVAGVVCLGLAAIAAAWGVEHRAWYDEVDRLGQRTVKGAELVKTGPVDGRAARVTDVELGDPIVVAREGDESPDVWFAVYPARTGKGKGPPTGAPKALFHTRSLPSREAADVFRHNAEVTGIVLNGLPGAESDFPAPVATAYPNLDAGTVWVIDGDRSWQQRGIYWSVALAAIFAILGLWLAIGGLAGQAGPKRLPETRSLPGLKPLDAKNSPRAKRAYYHSKCGSNTLAAGDDLVGLECPFRERSGSFCCGCGKVVRLADLTWEDTGEGLVEYRQRIASVVPIWKRLRLYWLGSSYEGAVNLGIDTDGRIAQPLKDPPGWPRPNPAFRPVAARR